MIRDALRALINELKPLYRGASHLLDLSQLPQALVLACGSKLINDLEAMLPNDETDRDASYYLNELEHVLRDHWMYTKNNQASVFHHPNSLVTELLCRLAILVANDKNAKHANRLLVLEQFFCGHGA